MFKKVTPKILSVLFIIAVSTGLVYGDIFTPGAGGPGVLPPDGDPFASEFLDDFDSYPDASQMHGQGGWKGWDNNPAAGALVTSAFFNSSPHSVDIVGASDLVHEFTGYTTGQWTLTAWVFVPTGTVQSYFIGLNTYADGGPNNWSMQVFFDSVAGVVQTDTDGSSLPIIADSWVEIRNEINLDTNSQSFFYNNVLLYTASWTEGISGGGVLNIGALNLFANGATRVLYDDITLCPNTGCVTPVTMMSFSVD